MFRGIFLCMIILRNYSESEILLAENHLNKVDKVDCIDSLISVDITVWYFRLVCRNLSKPPSLRSLLQQQLRRE